MLQALYQLVNRGRGATPTEKGSECARFESLHIARSSRGTPKDSQRDGLPRLRYFFDLASTSAAGNPHRPAGPIEGALQNIEAVVVNGHALLHQHCDPRLLKRRTSYSFLMIALGRGNVEARSSLRRTRFVRGAVRLTSPGVKLLTPWL